MPALTTPIVWGLLLSFCLLALLGVVAEVSSIPGRDLAVSASVSPATVRGASGSGDPSGSNSNELCPSSGPTILGIEWNCVAILNLTEVALILAGIGIVAYVFKDSDRAELPGDATDVPVTAEEEAEYQRDRELGVPYHPQKSPSGEERE